MAAVRDVLLPADATFPDAGALKRTLAEGGIEVVASPQTAWKPLNRASTRARRAPSA